MMMHHGAALGSQWSIVRGHTPACHICTVAHWAALRAQRAGPVHPAHGLRDVHLGHRPVPGHDADVRAAYRDRARPCHIRARTGLTPLTSAPGLGSPAHICAGSPLPAGRAPCFRHARPPSPSSGPQTDRRSVDPRAKTKRSNGRSASQPVTLRLLQSTRRQVLARSAGKHREPWVSDSHARGAHHQARALPAAQQGGARLSFRTQTEPWAMPRLLSGRTTRHATRPVAAASAALLATGSRSCRSCRARSTISLL